jgi:cation diffusion facilitator family transporter
LTGKREKKIVVASRIAVFVNAALSILKISAGLVAGSLATVADGIDSASDILTSLITLFTAHIISRPPNMKYPYGYSRADTMAAKILAFIVFFAGAQLAVSSTGRLINPQPHSLPKTIALIAIIISIISKQILAYYLKNTGKKVKSKMLIANAKNMQSDVVISLSVLTGLLFTFYFKMPVLDTITALLVSIWIMGVAVKIFFESSLELMDGVDNPDVYKKIIDACKEVEGVSNPHRIRVRKIANNYLISLDIEADGNMTLTAAHDLSLQVEQLIKEKITDIFDVLVHVEPSGNKEPDEAFGISEKDVVR